ncbi:hypothetical protein JCM8547_006093 [Rhodosporidiobolus lusitaniae]
MLASEPGRAPARNIPPELRAPLAPLSDPYAALNDETELETDLLDEKAELAFTEMTAVIKMDEEQEMEMGGETLVGSQETEHSVVLAAPSQVTGSTARSRSSIVGRALFPPQPRTTKPSVSSSGSPRSKRLSLPMTSTTSSSSSSSSLSTASSLLSKRSSLSDGSSTFSSRSSSRKSTSPSHNAGRRLLSSSLPSSTSTSSAREGSLLALPVAKQLHDLKSRNAVLTKSLASQQAEANVKLAKAAERIKQLEEAQESGKTDAEGWEAEAQRLAAELAVVSGGTSAVPPPAAGVGAEEKADLLAKISTLERTLASESSKKRRAKEMQAKMRCELVNRRWKEKWEVELLEREERKWEIKVVKTEAELGRVRYELECEKTEREEVQTTLAAALKRLSALSASRKLLLASFSTSETTIASLRSELASTKLELDNALSAAQETEVQLREELEEIKAEVEKFEKGGKKSDESKGKEVEKEMARREKAEGEVKELKAQLKTAQSALKAAKKTASAAELSASDAQTALAALKAQSSSADTVSKKKERDLIRSSSTIKAVPALSAHDDEDEPAVDADEEEHPYAAASPAPVKTASAKAKKPRARKSASAVPADEEPAPLAAEEDAEVYKPAKSKSRGAPMAGAKLKLGGGAAAVKEKKAKPVVVVEEEEEQAEQDEEAEQEEERTPRPAKPAAVEKKKPTADPAFDKPSKKRKASVLGDKSANTSHESSLTGSGVGQLKIKKSSSKTKKLQLELSGDEGGEEEEKGEQPKKKVKKDGEGEGGGKKKKIKLFGEKKGFSWGGIENANVNSTLGIPLDVSPIKVKAKKGSVLGKLGGAGGKKSIF